MIPAVTDQVVHDVGCVEVSELLAEDSMNTGSTFASVIVKASQYVIHVFIELLAHDVASAMLVVSGLEVLVHD